MSNVREVWIDGVRFGSVSEAAKKIGCFPQSLHNSIHNHKGKSAFTFLGHTISMGPVPAPIAPKTEKKSPSTKAATPVPSDEIQSLRQEFRALQVAVLKQGGIIRMLKTQLGELREMIHDGESA